jgi:hypothetical protein
MKSARMVVTVLLKSLAGRKARCTRKRSSIVSCLLPGTHGFLRFQNWKLYAERGLAHEAVTIWMYEGMLRIEYQAMTLSEYTVELQEDQKSLRQVSNPRLAQTPFHSPQLTLIDLGPHEWLSYWHLPPRPPVRRKSRVQGVIQLPLFDLPAQEKAAGGQ